MSRFDSPLNNIRIASPCPADWDAMYGDERKRFCKDCKLNVYNLSGMSQEEAERLVTNAEGRLCVRFFRRKDGTVITQDCPVGWAKIKQRTRIYATAALSMLMAMLTGLFFVSLFKRQPTMIMGDIRPVATPTPTPLMGNYTTMGAIAVNREVVMGKPAAKSDDDFKQGRVKGLAGDRD